MRVVFQWREDRFGHVVERWTGSGWQTVLESIEGAPSDVWPPSPALQSLQLEERAGGKVALLVGMAGRSHWSASVEADSGSGRLVFDIACRVTQEPAWLGSRYRLGEWSGAGDPWPRTSDQSSAIRGQTSEQRPLIEAMDSAAVDWPPEEVLVRPAAASEELPRTVRWRYSIPTKAAATSDRLGD